MDSPFTNKNERGSTSYWRIYFYIIYQKNLFVQTAFRLTKTASHLQNITIRIQRLRLVYKYLLVDLQNCISPYKVASGITTDHVNRICHYNVGNIIFHCKFIFFSVQFEVYERRITQWEWLKNKNNTLGMRYVDKGVGGDNRNEWK